MLRVRDAMTRDVITVEPEASAAQAWGRIQKPAGLAPLYALSRDAEPVVRRAAVFSLGQFGWKAEFSAGREGEILTYLIRYTDPDREVRLLAIEPDGQPAGQNRRPIA